MKQLLQNMRDGKTVVEDVPVPEVRVGTALVRTAASLVSAGTERMVVEFAEKSLVGKARSRPDLAKQVIEKARREGWLSTVQAAFNRLDQPMALGYSSAGTIMSLGGNMQGLRLGQRVACAGGGYAVHAQYAVVPRNLLAALPDDVSFEAGAFATLGAIAMHGYRLGQPQVGERVAIIGLGLLGYLAAQIAAAGGCSVLGIDVDPKRVALADSMGIRAVLRAEAAEAGGAFTSNRGFDVVLICADTASNDPVELAATLARDRGRIVATGAVGLEIPRKPYYEKELSFINSRSYGPGRYDALYEEGGNDYPAGYVRWTEGRNLESVVELMGRGQLKVEPLITHRFPIEEAAQAYEVITGKKKQAFLGVLLTYEQTNEEGAKRIEFPRASAQASDVRLGVIGAGNFANATLLPALRKIQGIELAGIASAGGLHAQYAAKKYGFRYACSSAEEIIGDVSINTVAILTRHDTHAELAIQALKAGKNVFVEKPLAINADQLAVIQRQLKRNDNGLLTVGFNRRFAPLAGRLAEFFRGRGEPMHIHYRVNAGYIPANHWTQDPLVGGGRIIGEACHFVDFISFLVGEAPVCVSAQALPDSGKYREDNASITLSFPDGSIGVIDYLANGDKSLAKERVEVFCGGKVSTLEDFRRLQTVTGGKRQDVKTAQDKGWKDEWAAFAKAIKQGGEPPIPYVQLIGVTKATLAAVESIHTRQPVEV
ncbi:MAG TPA: bi-domain-containing oxidoreductase [Anaerolineales bacterium]|nr:bi-domain-containing oxidoreductase [Anaerolineales bacterium]